MRKAAVATRLGSFSHFTRLLRAGLKPSRRFAAVFRSLPLPLALSKTSSHADTKALNIFSAPGHWPEGQLYPPRLQVQLGPDHVVLEAGKHLEPELDAQGAHLLVLREHVRDQLCQPFLASEIDQAAVEFGSQPFMLGGIDRNRSQFGLIETVQLTQPADRENLRLAFVVRLAPPPAPFRGRNR